MRRKHYFAIALMYKINCGKLSWYKQNFFENFKYFKRIVSTLSSIGNRDGRTVKFLSPSPILNPQKINPIAILICKIFENHQSNPVLIRQCKTMFFILPHEGKYKQPFGVFKI